MSELIGLRSTFLVAGLVPALLAVVAILWARLPQDEIAHPLDVPAEPPAELPAEDGPAAGLSPSSKTS